MDIEKLIEQLNDWNEKYISNLCGDRTIKCEEYCIKDDCLIVKAATALSTLQAENAQLRAELEQKLKLIAQQAAELERRDALLKEQEAELEQVKRERDSIEQDFRAFAKQWWEEDSGFPCRWCKSENSGGCEWKAKHPGEICAGMAFEWRGQKDVFLTLEDAQAALRREQE